MAKSFQITLPNTKVQNVEDILENLGGFGRFQFILLVLILSLEIPTAFVIFSPIFTGLTPKDWTCNGETVSSQEEICSCNGTLSSQVSSIVSEWNLICDSAWVSDFVTTIQMVGLVLGNAIFGQVADWYGRKRAYLGTVLFLSLGTIISAAAPNVYIYTAARVLCGAGFSGFVLCSGIYAMEFMVPKWRIVCSSVGPLGEGIMILGVLGYYFQDSWRNLLWATVTPFCLIAIIFPLIPESPRWLLKRQRVEDAHNVFAYIARVNGKPNIEFEVLKELAERENAAETKVKNITYVEFLKDKEVRFITFCLVIMWATWVLMYFGISFNLKNMGGNRFLNVVFLGLCDAVGYPASFLMNTFFTRRQSVATFMTSAAVILVSLAIFHVTLDLSDTPVVILTMCLFGKFAAAGARASLRTFTGESFPTAVRNTGFGIVGFIGAGIGLVAPQIAYLGSKWPSVPLFIFAVCSFIGAVVSFLLKETKGIPLKEGVRKLSKRISVASIVNSVRRFSQISQKKQSDEIKE